MENFLKNTLSKFNIFTAAKDKAGRYVYCNEKVAEALGLDSPQQIIRKTDYNLCWNKQAELYIAGDRKVMLGNPFINIIEPQTHVDGTKKILISKLPILDNRKKCIGVVGSYIDVSDCFIKQKKIKLSLIEDKRFYLGKIFNNEYLTKREVQVFKRVLFGMSAKQIAYSLSSSPRTIETHIDKIKIKLQCHTIGDIIMTALKTGLTFSILDIDNWEDVP